MIVRYSVTYRETITRRSRWVPDASNLGADQLAQRGLKRGIDYTFDDGGALKLYYGALFSVQVPPPVIVVIRPTGTAVAASPSASATPASPVTGARSGSPEGTAS